MWQNSHECVLGMGGAQCPKVETAGGLTRDWLFLDVWNKKTRASKVFAIGPGDKELRAKRGLW